ncbi:cationic amino acid transporter 4-like [Tropilaelaps mercedesae]|uniref:Cationic amino acid transporter 4-like n=1 Tax=Tropilaelaps mercedesae TaxID=418985 RepID=A0A1V9XUM9_9ACAR|nr:cationic amino acid transporter 4-like [Tropilaelaps mercedesae]
MVAGIASLLAALAYAEFGVKFPRAGSAYSYSYFSVGEFWAFLVGWNVLLENIIGLSYGEISTKSFFYHNATSWLNKILCIVNIVMLLVMISVGVYFADFDNWTNPATRLYKQLTKCFICFITDGFMPFGVNGVLSASATCFFAYVGFDAIAAAGEEAKNPQRSLPVATLCSMAVVTVLYVAVSAVLTLMINYQDIEMHSGLPAALALKGAVWAEVLVTIGALAGMSTVLIGTLYALTRIAYAMADDGLIHWIFGKVAAKSQIPLVAMYAFSFLAAVLSVVLDIETLVEMMSIGTLFAYLIVSGGVIIFRYRHKQILKTAHELKPIGNDNSTPVSINCGLHMDGYGPTGQKFKPRAEWLRSFFPRSCRQQTVVASCVCMITACTFKIGFFIKYNGENLGEWYSIILMTLLAAVVTIAFFVIVAHEQCEESQNYKMPLVPLLPVSSIVINAFLMTTLQLLTWGRLILWLFIGLINYFLYGIRHSKLN